MKIKQTIIALAVVLGVGAAAVATGQPAYAAEECGGVQTSIISCSEGDGTTGVRDSGLWGILRIAINIMTAGVGVLAVAGIVYGAILYTSAGGSQDQVKKAVEIIRNVVIGLLAFALMWAVLNFIIPGGLGL